MPQEHEQNGSTSYLPTSLDFINLPNPIQPAPQLQKHPLNGTPHLEKARLENASKQDLFKLILEPPAERPSKRQKTSLENPHLDLPKLPARHNTKRHRLPPTLSGLHQPPPESGLLPSINTEQPEVPPPRIVESGSLNKANDEPSIAQQGPAASDDQQPAPKPAAKSDKIRTRRTKWSDDETRCLLKGVEQFGIGSWTKILKCPEYSFNKRTALDLKDRFRVCCPDSYKRTRLPKYVQVDSTEGREASQVMDASVAITTVDEISSSTREKYGVSEPFKKSERRSRTGWSKEEDEALLRGFRKYGNEWAAMRDDPGLGLSHRQRTDLRGRMRVRYPEQYAKASLSAKKDETSAATKGTQDEPTNDTNVAEDYAFPETTNKTSNTSSKAVETRRPPQPRLFSLDDIYLGPFGIDEDEEENERIVLDRGILDWATTDNPRPSISNAPGESHRSHGINPQMTLNLPKPNAVLPNSTTTSLPSLATLLPPETVDPDQLELPSLSQWYDDQTRAGGMTLEEILS